MTFNFLISQVLRIRGGSSERTLSDIMAVHLDRYMRGDRTPEGDLLFIKLFLSGVFDESEENANAEAQHEVLGTPQEVSYRFLESCVQIYHHQQLEYVLNHINLADSKQTQFGTVLVLEDDLTATKHCCLMVIFRDARTQHLHALFTDPLGNTELPTEFCEKLSMVGIHFYFSSAVAMESEKDGHTMCATYCGITNQLLSRYSEPSNFKDESIMLDICKPHIKFSDIVAFLERLQVVSSLGLDVDVMAQLTRVTNFHKRHC